MPNLIIKLNLVPLKLRVNILRERKKTTTDQMINSDRKLGIALCVDEVSSAKLRLTHGLCLVTRNHSNGEK